MRKFLIALLLLAGVVTTANLAFADTSEDFVRTRELFYHGSHSAAAKYSSALTSQALNTDSTYVGYSPGFGSVANPWSIRASVGGPNVHKPPKAGCMWNWDPEEAGGNGYINGDSLQGWWPLRLEGRYVETPATNGTTTGDWETPGGSLDYGNMCNYYPVHGRTFGVVGVWHRDQGGDPTGIAAGSNGVTWTPLQGTKSAWCGLRGHADATAPVDGITGNPFTADAAMINVHIRFSAAVATPKWPGYADSWDQILYKDIDMTGFTGSDLSLAFTYSTRMSTAADLTGWFDKDPLTITSDGLINCAPGNYISNADLAGTVPIDSFMVYIGRPTEGTFQPFNGLCAAPSGRKPIFDPLRRWFDEVLEANDATLKSQLVSASGIDSARAVSVTIPNSQLASMVAVGGKVRLAFRVKTNTRGSDQTVGSYNSRGRGAAQVDAVTYAISGGGPSSPAGWGDFEAANSIDNTQSALNAWRSTGKPPTIVPHVERLTSTNAPYDDLCGADPTITGRICSMAGGVIVFGIHDLGEQIGDPVPYTADHEPSSGIISPAIQLRSNNGVWPNTIGITAPGSFGDAIATGDLMVDYETFTKAANYNSPPIGTGILYRWLLQSYPQLTGGNAAGAGKPMWGNVIRSGGNYQTDAICFRSLPGITGAEGSASSLLKYSAAAGENSLYPDSIRIGWSMEAYCWDPTVLGCNPIGGLYIDNVSLVLIDGAPQSINASIWDFYQTAFPWNELVTPVYAASFDTAGILAKTGLDIGPADGLNSFNVPGDSIAVISTGLAPMRMDLVFRVLPGPGNYKIVGNAPSGLTPAPSAGNPVTGVGRPSVVANVASSNFWETFLANNGPFGTPGGHPGGVWSPNVWNSARCDTANNAAGLFPRAAGAIINNAWSGTYHEIELGIGGGDAYSATTVTRLGVGTKRHKCFLATNTALPNDIDCEHDPDGINTPATGVFPGIYDLTWVLATGSGYGPDNGVHPYSREFTIQGTKMIPDGLLTPGAHVEYFWRKAENGSTAMTGMLPDTNIVRPQLGERNVEGHRFAGFGALPDRWKQGGYNHPLFGLFANSVQPACLLAVNDQTTNSNDWVGWVSVTDTIGATSSLKWGAEVGWHAKGGGADINVPANNIDRAGRLGFIAEHGGNPGTTWDGYQIIGAEDTGPAGSFGQRYAKSDASNTQINDKRGLQAPTLEQLKAFYKIIFFMTGNLNALAVGPQGNRGSDDQQLIKDYLLSGSPSTLNRVFWANGDGFVEGMEKETDLTKQPDLNLNYLGVGLQSNEYRTDSGDAKTTIDLKPSLTSSINSGEIYGVRNTCNHTNDVLKVAIGAVQALSSPFTYYGTTTSYAASILKTYSAAKPWAALTEGYSIIDLMNRFGSDTRGRSKYFLEVLTKQFGGVCPVVGTPVVNLDVPNLSEGNAFADFVNLRNNPLSSGKSTIKFGLAQADRVEIKVYDVTGREVRELANRQFVAGEHTIVWDGSDNTGRPVARGVYFTQVRYKDSGFSDAKKLTVLK